MEIPAGLAQTRAGAGTNRYAGYFAWPAMAAIFIWSVRSLTALFWPSLRAGFAASFAGPFNASALSKPSVGGAGCSGQSRRMIGQEPQIWIACGNTGDTIQSCEKHILSATASQDSPPFMNFCMPVTEGKAAGIVVVGRRRINDVGRIFWREKGRVIHAVGVLIKKGPSFRRSRDHQG